MLRRFRGALALVFVSSSLLASAATPFRGRIEVHFAEQYRVLVDNPRYTIAVDVYPNQMTALSELKLSKGGQPILDKAAGLGEARTFWGPVLGQLHWQSAQQTSLDPRGDYHLDLRLADGSTSSVDFHVGFTMPTAVPQMAVPINGELFTTATPTFLLQPFETADANDFEAHHAQVFVNANPGPDAVTVFRRAVRPPATTTALPIDPSPGLADGEYVAFYNHLDRVTQGPVELVREVGQSTHFVKRAPTAGPVGVPAEVKGVRLRFRRVFRQPKQDHVFQVRVDLDADPSQVVSLALSAPDGKKLFDSRQGTGHAGDDLDESPTLIRSVSTRPDQDGGIYELAIGIAGRPTPSIVPVIVPPNYWSTADAPNFPTPRNGEDVGTPTPTFRIRDFVSPQFLPLESRLADFTINFHPTNDPATFVSRWHTLLPVPFPQTISLGQGAAADVAPLLPGEYRFGVGYIERRASGRVTLERETATIACFWVGQGSCRVN